uniref:Uncharacterized protein n=1 Tax=Thermogemmatispora argillosa TaxID=2045280 RepID=A0A455SZL5_9CHLR|nr:hypothetical protein KTA_12050 [Thermogemmatispora argillosa]
MAELSCSAGAPDQQPLDDVLFADRAGSSQETPADLPPVAGPAHDPAPETSSPVPSPRCAMRVALTEGAPPELVHVPYIEVSDPDFAAGYHYGATSYFEELFDDEEHKARELIDRDLTEVVMDLYEEGHWDQPLDGKSWRAWAAQAAGFLAGLISARIPSALPLYGNCPRCHQPVDACGGCRRCDTCTCPSLPGTSVAH